MEDEVMEKQRRLTGHEGGDSETHLDIGYLFYFKLIVIKYRQMNDTGSEMQSQTQERM